MARILARVTQCNLINKKIESTKMLLLMIDKEDR